LIIGDLHMPEVVLCMPESPTGNCTMSVTEQDKRVAESHLPACRKH
jgi:hypothetical protein